MSGYLINFSIYTLAMIGVIFVALFVFKNFANKGFSKKSDYLSIVETMNLSTRKTIYVIKAGEQKFLVASDIDRTSLIAKLDDGVKVMREDIRRDDVTREDKSSELNSFDGLESMDDFASIINFQKNKSKEPVMRELARKLSAI